MTSANDYRVPPQPVVDLVDAAVTPEVSLSPDRRRMLIMEKPGWPPISELAQPEARLAGMRINPATNGRSREACCNGLLLKRLDGGAETRVGGLPEGARLGNVMWSPDSRHAAFSMTRDDGIELWLLEVAAARSRQLVASPLNEAHGSAVRWLSDSHTLVCRTVPGDRPEAPAPSAVPTGPITQESIGKTAPAPTYQDLLNDAHDEAMFEHYSTVQIETVTIDGVSEPIGSADMIARAEPSPDGQCLLVETIQRPYSYLVPAYRFPHRVEVWDLAGNVVHQVADLPLAEEVPIASDAAPEGPRWFSWRADAPATLCWVEAQDGGDPKAEAEVRDQVFTHASPFDGDPAPLAALGLRYAGIAWGSDDLAWLRERWWQTRRTRTWAVAPARPAPPPTRLFDRSSAARYSDPGQPLTRPTPNGTRVLHTRDDGRALLLAGAGASPEGDRPFLDELDWTSGETRRLWRSEAPYYEAPVTLVDEQRLLTRRESKEDPPNYFLRDLSSGALQALTAFPHPTPQLRDVHKELVRYRRQDDVDLTATLYLPPGHTPESGPIPLLMWAYPREFKSAAAASQVTDSPHRFVRVDVRSALPWLALGYAVLDGPTMPIVGEGDEEPNDTYVAQLVGSARAAVDYVVERGVADRDHIAIAGHSYGAFMTANLLAHSDLFCAGIGRSGAYNRTLTPFGFQCEERTLWEAPEVYVAMSSFVHADKIDAPLLLIHGAADNNSGTFPMQSERLYSALKGHGKTTRLVMLPHESHGYQARESIMHMLWEMAQWLERYVRGAEKG